MYVIFIKQFRDIEIIKIELIIYKKTVKIVPIHPKLRFIIFEIQFYVFINKFYKVLNIQIIKL
jgi:hypothetical protein